MNISIFKYFNIRREEQNRGFVILFAVTLSSILLAIALGVLNIALKEIKFGTSARDTNDAFFAADTGIEYVLFRDKPSSFYSSPSTTQEIISGLGSTNQGCAIVTITKSNFVVSGVTYVATTIVSKGYNVGKQDGTCTSTNPDRIEREIKINY